MIQFVLNQIQEKTGDDMTDAKAPGTITAMARIRRFETAVLNDPRIPRDTAQKSAAIMATISRIMMGLPDAGARPDPMAGKTQTYGGCLRLMHEDIRANTGLSRVDIMNLRQSISALQACMWDFSNLEFAI